MKTHTGYSFTCTASPYTGGENPACSPTDIAVPEADLPGLDGQNGGAYHSAAGYILRELSDVRADALFAPQSGLRVRVALRVYVIASE